MNLDFGDFVVKRTIYSPGLRQSRHMHDYSNVTIVTAGQIEESAASGEYCARPSSVVLKAAGCEHEDRIGGRGASSITIQFLHTSAFARALEGTSWAWFDSIEIVRRALKVQHAFITGDRRKIEIAAVALVESVAAREPNSGNAPAWVARMRSALDERFDESIRFDALARDFGLHPVYASRAFRRHAGVSMTDYVRALRLRHARQHLSSTRRSIAAIAAESGFADSSHLTRTFNRLLGVTPRAYRRMTQG